MDIVALSKTLWIVCVIVGFIYTVFGRWQCGISFALLAFICALPDMHITHHYKEEK